MHHPLQLLLRLPHISFKIHMVEKKFLPALRKKLIKLGIHPLYILRDGILDVIPLRRIGRIFKHPKFLVDEAIGRLDAIGSNLMIIHIPSCYFQSFFLLLHTFHRQGNALALQIYLCHTNHHMLMELYHFARILDVSVGHL